MTLLDLQGRLAAFVAEDGDRCVRAGYALRPELTGLAYFDAPLAACARANDPLFAQFREDPKVIGSFFRLPSEWLAGARSVISIFFPFARGIHDSNREGLQRPSDEWLHSRIEGQSFLEKALRQVQLWLEEAGARAAIPCLSPEFKISTANKENQDGWPRYVSNWSERHVAYIAGLGTFGLSKHIITSKGVCGRFGSVITDAELAPTPRPYTSPFEYCTSCNACIRRCPVDAIAPEGKDNRICSAFLDGVKERFAPRYGCGKCQISVPCEWGRPRAPQPVIFLPAPRPATKASTLSVVRL